MRLSNRILDLAVGRRALVALIFPCLIALEISALAMEPENQRTFFTRDVSQLIGRPYRSSDFNESRMIRQSFTSHCGNLNRIVLPFYVEGKPQGDLLFSLYPEGENKEPVFSAAIDPKKWPPPGKIGTYDIDAVLHYIWIPPLENSKNKTYRWELKTHIGEDFRGLGIYLTDQINPQLGQVEIDGVAREKTYAAFYTFCQYRFKWDEMLISTGQRLWREKYFIGVYIALLAGIVVAIKRSGRME